MEVKRVCEHCGELNELNSSALKHEDVSNIFGCVRLTYYKCSKCKKKIVVQIDDAVSRKILADLKKIILRCTKKNIKNETISPKDVKNREKLSKRLIKRRKELEQIYSGTRLYKENGEIFTEGLTISGGCDII